MKSHKVLRKKRKPEIKIDDNSSFKSIDKKYGINFRIRSGEQSTLSRKQSSCSF